MRTILALGVWLTLVGVLAVGCNGPGSDDQACTNFGGVCQNENLACAETFPYPCASATNVCCRPSKNPGPSATPTPTSSPPAESDAAAE
jgi:hypothetical protein